VDNVNKGATTGGGVGGVRTTPKFGLTPNFYSVVAPLNVNMYKFLLL